MATTQIADVIVPAQFTSYIVENSIENSALVQSGIVTRNAEIDAQLNAGAFSFTVPFWKDLADDEANIGSDDPAILAAPRKLSSGRQIVRKSFLNGSWAAMSLASELAGANALTRIQDRVSAYWVRQAQRRLVASLQGILLDNVANAASDMVNDISAGVGAAGQFSAAAVIDTAALLGDAMRGLSAIGMHSATYKAALKADLIATLPNSQGGFIQTFRGLAILIDDGLPLAAGKYTSVLFGPGAVGYGLSAPTVAPGTEVFNQPNAGNGAGQQTLHSRVNLALHPLGFQWKEITVTGGSPSIAELALAANWTRVAMRKNVPLAFFIHKLA